MNKIAQMIKSKEKQNFPFVPDFYFYNKVGINRKRWGMLIRNEVELTLPEAERIAKFFNCKVNDIYHFKPELIEA